MFSVKESECVGFESKWKVKRVYSEGTSQTTEYSLQEISTNTSTTAEVQTQTETVDNNATGKVDMEKLADFLAKVYPNVTKELNEAVNSKAFKGHYRYDESELPDARLVHTLNVTVDTGDGDKAVRVSAITWNSTGNTLAVACNHLHKTWCHHSGVVSFYTFDRNDKLPEVPHRKLTITACVNVLRFHPNIPSVIACGANSGEIIIWNIQHNEGDSIVTKVNGHEEGVTDVSWINNIEINNKSLLLATSSLDGYLNLWNFSLPSASLTIKLRYKIKSPVFARKQRTTSVPEEIAKKIVRGILSFDFSPYVPDMFVVGVEGSLIVQCSTLGTKPLKGTSKEIPVADPVVKYFEPHEGEIITVRFSPNHKDMFMTCATDGEIRIYIIEQEAPARVIFLEKQLQHVSWVPYQENLVTGCGDKGILEIFHLIQGRPISDVTSDKIVQTKLLHIEVNKQRCTTVAIGNDKGELQLWNVPWGLFALQKVQ